MRKLVIAILCCGMCLAMQGQTDPLYSQYIWNKLVINPGYTGAREYISASFFYRNQWTGIEGAPSVFSVGLHSPLKNPNLALGFHFYNDKIGPVNQYAFNASYAYRFLFENGALGLGLQAGIASFNTEWEKLDAYQSGEAGLFDDVANNSIAGTAGLGAYFNTDKLSAGFSIPNLLPSGEKVPFRKSHYYLTFDYLFNFGKKNTAGKHTLSFKPSMLLKATKAVNSQLDINGSFIFVETAAIGFGYRTNNSYIFLAEYVLVKPIKSASTQVRIGYAFDLDNKDYRSAAGGTHEVMLIFEYASNKQKIVSPRVF